MSRHLTTIFLYFGSLKSVFSPYFVKFQVQIVLINLFLDLGHMYFGHISVLKNCSLQKKMWMGRTYCSFLHQKNHCNLLCYRKLYLHWYIYLPLYISWVTHSTLLNGTFKILEHCTYNLTWAGPGWSRWCKVFLCQQNNLIFSFKFSLSQRGI